MRHSFLDKYSDRDSFFHRLDPRTKIVSAAAFIVVIVLTPRLSFFQGGAFLVLLVAAAAASCVPFRHIFGRTLYIIPFAATTAVFLIFSHGFQARTSLMIAEMLVKSALSAMALVLLVATTPFPALLKGLEKLKVPVIFTMLLSFMYRYIFVLIDEAQCMERAWKTRYFGGHYLRQIRVFGGIIASLFLRTFERGERVYQSMLARGFDGRMVTMNILKFGVGDVVFLAGFTVVVALVRIGGVGW